MSSFEGSNPSPSAKASAVTNRNRCRLQHRKFRAYPRAFGALVARLAAAALAMLCMASHDSASEPTGSELMIVFADAMCLSVESSHADVGTIESADLALSTRCCSRHF